MRVIAGNLRGLKLSAPQGTSTRPTLDRVKEAVFSMLTPHLCDASVLDIFAGSGAMGIEALSRGARSCVFVENNRNAAECIKNNLISAKLTNNISLLVEDAFLFLKKTREKFDLIFLDPPYADNFYSDALRLIKQNDVLSENGLIVAEWDHDFGFTSDLDGFTIIKDKKYGRVEITVLKRG